MILVPRSMLSTFFVPNPQINRSLCAPETPWPTHSPAQGLPLSESRPPARSASATRRVILLPVHPSTSRGSAGTPGMNPVVPGLGNELLGDGASSRSRQRAADSSGERWMPLPVSFLRSPLCQADNTLLVLGLNFISVTSWSARLAAFPWTSLSVRGRSDP